MTFALSMVLCGGLGLAIVSTGLRIEASPARALLEGSLSAGFGLGAFSVLLVLFRAFGGHSLWGVDAVVLVLVLLLLAFFSIRRRTNHGTVLLSEDLVLPHWLRHVLVAAFSISLSAALYCAIRRVIAFPHGEGWDAFAIWNLHARFLFRGGPAWRDGFNSLIAWSHPDYPLLIPGAIAHFWTLAGHESQVVPAIIGLVFTISTGGLLFSGLRILRGLNVAMLGGIALIATPAFIEQGTSEYADVPLSFFLLATVVLVCFDEAVAGESSGAKGLLVLAGLASSFGAWTKNEGLLFLLALLVGCVVVSIRDRRRSPTQSTGSLLVPILLSALPMLAVILWFKHFVAPPGDLFASAGRMFGKMIGDTHYGVIAGWFLKQFLRFGHWQWIPGTVLVLCLYLILGQSAAPAASAETGAPRSSRPGVGATPGFRASVFAILITLAGYFLVYVITPYDVYWHLRFSLNRLFLQLWPSVIFLCFLRLRVTRSPTTSSRITSK